MPKLWKKAGNVLLISMTRKILTTFYSGCFQSFVFSFLVYLVLCGKGSCFVDKIKNAISDLKKRSNRYIIYFLFYFYLLYNDTVFSRTPTYSPFSDVFGGWAIYKTQYHGLSFDVISNVLMFVPLTILFSLAFLNKKHIKNVILQSVKLSICVSLSIEILQILFMKGTFQFADILFNTSGGLIGALLYVLIKTLIRKGKTDGYLKKKD